jgi:predicted ester cyclase
MVAWWYSSISLEHTKGEFQEIPPINKKITIRSADLYKIEDEIIIGHRDVFDL